VRAKPLVLDPPCGEAIEGSVCHCRGDRHEADPVVDGDPPDVGSSDPDPGGQRPDEIARPQPIVTSSLDRDRDHGG
jgi:hypothetical protein